MTRITALALIMITLFAFGSLFAGAAYLEWLLPWGLPFGNALTALGLSSAAVAALGVSKRGTILRWLSIVSVLLATLWLPVSIGLAGNLALNFNGVNGSAWMFFSLATFVFALISMSWAIVSVLSRKELSADPPV